jgi:hypothetical protein
MKQLLGLVLLVAAVPALAQWMQVGGDDAKAFTYADPATIREHDHIATMTLLIDFKNAQRAPYGPEYLSQKMQQEFDCVGRRTRVLEVASYAGQKAEEEVVAVQDAPGEWKPVAPQTVAEELWNIACGKRPE